MLRKNRFKNILSMGMFCLLAITGESQAYVFYDTNSCSPGSHWPTTSPVQVYFLLDSFNDEVGPLGFEWLSVYARAIGDVEAVIDEFNSVEGSTLQLEFAGSILGDDNLDGYSVDDFGNHTIMIGFTDLSAPSNASAPAWAPGNPDDACEYSRRHVNFKKGQNWIFGPPETADVDGKYFDGGISFRAVLLHEMGHTVGLSHESDVYAVMIHGTKAWTRGRNEVMQMELLPDDINAINTLYNDGNDNLQNIDVSVTNSWFMSATERTDYNTANDIRRSGCEDIEILLFDLNNERTQLVLLIPNLQGPGLQAALDQLQSIENSIVTEEANLADCYYKETTAAQKHNCKVSSRGDEYADKADQLVYCGVNSTPVSNWPTVSNNVCPGDYIQMRYTLNNKSLQDDLQLKMQVWFSLDDDLEVNGANKDYKSPDIREFTLASGRSATIGNVFRVPQNIPSSQTHYRVYVRAKPYELYTDDALFGQDIDQWNNSIRVRGDIVISASCP